MRFLRMLAVILFAAAVVVAGDDPWDGETASWDKKTADKILNNSPWAKRVATKVDYVKEKDQSNAAQGGSSTMRNDRGDMQPTDFAIVWWWSAKTPRRAYLRLLQLSGNQFEPDEVQKYCESPMPGPTITVLGGGQMVAIAGKLAEQELMKAAWLDHARLKRKIAPEGVKVMTLPDGAIDRIAFIFPEQIDGQPLVQPEDKRIVFRWKLPKNPKQKVEDAEQFEAAFEPKKMMARGTADF